ncbi:hypothetical protein B0H15DRAFT_944623 [Mycena belliarum]|uniref:DUF6534 domain-containing protein n=1 Tax=Mycena belliarum TaxID=1033014 RepID=A0AAD6Y068_9AGAR|nr:hypothetical protein B0H15DRAFT_944623 [Mycena belliae]
MALPKVETTVSAPTPPTGLREAPLGVCHALHAALAAYATRCFSDKDWTKAFVACIFLLDALNTLFDFAYLYDCLIVHFDDVPYLARATWQVILVVFATGERRAVALCRGVLPSSKLNNSSALGTDPATTAIIAFLVQLFYIRRVKLLTGSVWLALLVGACALSGLAGGIVTSVEVLLEPHFRDFIHFKSVVIVWLAGECVCDIMIATILVVHLRFHKSGIASTDILVDRIIRLTVQTGLATALCATIDLILFLSDPLALQVTYFLNVMLADRTGLHYFRHLSFNIPLCKLYTNSLLSSLNSRTPEGTATADSARGLMTSKRSSMLHPPPEIRRGSVFIDVESIRVSDVSEPPRMQEIV